jgi:hypothetical protein
VVVGERDGAHADRAQRLDRDRGSAEEERLARDSPGGFAPLGDAALEVADHQVERRAEFADFLAPEVLGPGVSQSRRDPPTEHDIAEQAD